MKREVSERNRIKGGAALRRSARRLLALTALIATLVCCTGFASFTFADGDAKVNAASEIKLTASQIEFTAPLSIEYSGAFAGVELAVQCGDGVTIESVSYSKDVSHAGPTEARGLVWFATFAGNNAYSGNLTATVRARYDGEGNSSMVIDHAAFHTIDDGAFRTENVPLRKTIKITREGAEDTAPPLTPPDNGGSPGAGNPPGNTVDPPASGGLQGGAAVQPEDSAGSTAGNKDNSPGGGSGKSGSKDSGSAKSVSTDKNTSPKGERSSGPVVNSNPGTKTPTPAGNAPAGTADIVAGLPEGEASGGQGGQNEQITSGISGDDTQAPSSSSKVPLAGGNAKAMTPESDPSALNIATLIMSLACLAGVAFLGFLFIKRRRNEKKNQEEVKKG